MPGQGKHFKVAEKTVWSGDLSAAAAALAMATAQAQVKILLRATTNKACAAYCSHVNQRAGFVIEWDTSRCGKFAAKLKFTYHKQGDT